MSTMSLEYWRKQLADIDAMLGHAKLLRSQADGEERRARSLVRDSLPELRALAGIGIHDLAQCAAKYGEDPNGSLREYVRLEDTASGQVSKREATTDEYERARRAFEKCLDVIEKRGVRGDAAGA